MNGKHRRDTLCLAEEAANWLAALKEDDGPSRAAFVKWLRSSPRHVEEFLLVTASDQALNDLDLRREVDVDRLIAQLDTDVVSLEGRAPAPSPPARPAGRVMIRWAAGLAAVVTAVAMTAGWLLGYFDGGDTYRTTVGEQRAVQLPDGSLVHLNARSKVIVRMSEEERHIRLLEGEALFKVARDAARPFTVETDRVVVRALGTAFNVDRRARDTQVAVLEGAVEVTPTRAGGSGEAPVVSASAHPASAPAKLSAGEEISVASGAIIARSRGKTADAVAWRERLLVFSDSSLEEIATEFNRYNRKQQLVIDDDDGLRDERFGGTFQADEPLALIEFLRRTPGLAVSDEGNRLVIRRR